MPKVSEFKEKTKKKNQKSNEPMDSATSSPEEDAAVQVTEVSTKSRRRPGNTHHAHEMKEQIEMATVETETASQDEEAFPNTASEDQDSHEEQTQENLEFYGSDLIKEHAPQLHRSLEIIAQDWKNDGRFEGLPVGHPLLQALASVGLQRAKKVEKKLEEKGVFMMARMGADIVKMKIDELRGKKGSND